ncbi:hypothetical protein D3C87_1169460 [compost metagenome]
MFEIGMVVGVAGFGSAGLPVGGKVVVLYTYPIHLLSPYLIWSPGLQTGAVALTVTVAEE